MTLSVSLAYALKICGEAISTRSKYDTTQDGLFTVVVGVLIVGTVLRTSTFMATAWPLVPSDDPSGASPVSPKVPPNPVVADVVGGFPIATHTAYLLSVGKFPSASIQPLPLAVPKAVSV